VNTTSRFIIEDDNPELLGRFTAWMDIVVKNARIDYLRRQRYKNHEVSIWPPPDAEPVYIENFSTDDEFEFTEDRLSEAFARLNETRRKILTMIFVDGLAAQEAADILDCSVDYVYKQKHRALKMLRDQIIDERRKRNGQ
jgi:RNA polymerase sigma-70 factor (ECF subfamily)